MVCVLIGLIQADRCPAQMLAGVWVDQTQQAIDRERMTDLRVIVLDHSGKPAHGVPVTVAQVKSDFQVGVVLPASGWPEHADPDAEFWRVINAVSLERMTAWPTLQPEPGTGLDEDAAWRIEQAINEAEARGLTIRWGPIVSADPGRVPGWVLKLDDHELADAIRRYERLILERFGRRVHQVDPYTQTLDHGFLEQRIGLAVIRELYQLVPTVHDSVLACARFDDALTPIRAQQMLRQITAMREAFIPVGMVAIDQRFIGDADRKVLTRLFERLGEIRHPVILSGLSVGGDSELNAAIHLETVLRVAMTRPELRGIYFEALTDDEAVMPFSALIDHTGQPTPSGRLVDHLYHELWRTDQLAYTDELGNVRLRAFPGTYRIETTLLDGQTLRAHIRLNRSPDERIVLLEPLHPSEPMNQSKR
ncbi:MAG: hypothetical protein Kow00105_14130 [Phycisphaeraceae bacterium]